MEDTYLSQHFRLSEFTRSATASARGIDNTPSTSAIDNLRRLCQEVLEPLRRHLDRPVVISSGYRSPALNKAVGGVANSQHMTGQAADIHIPDTATGSAWFEWMEDNLLFDQLIKEKSTKTSKSFWIHVSFRKDGKNRQQVKFLIKNE